MSQEPGGIDRLVVVAGVSCTGKTTLLRRLKGPAPPALPAPLADLDLSRFEVLNAIDLGRAGSLPRDCLLHYDLFRPVTFHDALRYEADPALDLLRGAGYRAVLTLWEDPGTLLDRSLARRRRLWRKVVRPSTLMRPAANLAAYRGARARRERMHPWLSDPDRLWSIYARWFAFVHAAGVEAQWCARPSAGLAEAVPVMGAPPDPFWPVAPDARSGPE